MNICLHIKVYTALVADAEEKLCRLLSEFGRVCVGREFRVNVGRNKVMRCSSAILNCEPLEEVDCFKYLGL